MHRRLRAAGKFAISSSTSSVASNRSAARSRGRKIHIDVRQTVAERSCGACPRLVQTSGQVDRSTIPRTAIRIDYQRRWTRTVRYGLGSIAACRCSERPKSLREWRRDRWMIGAPDVLIVSSGFETAWVGIWPVQGQSDGSPGLPGPQRDDRYPTRAPTPSVTYSQSSTFRSCGATSRCSAPIVA